ncbi:MAG: hypothetical protein JWP76_3373 [Dactylosporangium sp.]|nr:hypothetical protein [Dactylosporangium sp.]
MGQPADSGPAEPVIDLGELTGEAQPERDSGPAWPPRQLTLAFVAVLVVAALFGDAPRLLLRPVLTTTFAPTDFDIRGNVLYAFDSPYAPNRVFAYRLRDGQPLWQVRSPATTSYARVEQVGERTLLVPNLCTAAAGVSTVAVDTTSGREVWRRTGTVERLIDGGLVLMTRSDRMAGCGVVSAPADAPPVYWDAVDVETGVVRWSIEVPESVQISFDSDNGLGVRWVVFVARDGTVTTRDLLTGAVTGQVVLAELAQPRQADGAQPVPDDLPDLMIAGSQVMVVRHLSGQLDNEPTVLGVTAYDLVTLARRWTVRAEAGPSGVRDGFEYKNVDACGPMLCLRIAQSTVFLDPRDGTERWRSSMSLLSTVNGWALLADPRGLRGDQPPLEGLTVRDARTGKLRGAVPGWRIFSADVRRAANPLLGVVTGDRTWFARLDLTRMRLVTIGSAPGWYGSCAAEREYVACRRLDGSVRVWRAAGT